MRILSILFLVIVSGTLSVPYVLAEMPSPVKKLAVLPFDPPADDTDRKYLGYSLAGEVITRLSYLNGVVVRSFSTVRKYGNSGKMPKELAPAEMERQLDVEFLLTGVCSVDGNRLLLEVQLFRVTGREALWNGHLAVPLTELSTLPGMIAEGVIEGLSLRPSASERSRLARDVSSIPLAYEYYLRAIAQEPVTADEWGLAAGSSKSPLNSITAMRPRWHR